MKNTTIIKSCIALLAALSFGGALRAAEPTLSEPEVRRDGDRASVTFRVEAPRGIVKAGYTMALQPVITDGEHSVSLTPIVIRGRRAETLQSRYDRQADGSGTLTMRPGQGMDYRAAVAYQPWMEGADLVLENLSWGCCEVESDPVKTLAYNIMPALPVEYVAPEPVYVEPAPLSTGAQVALNYLFVAPESEWNPAEPVYDDDREKALIVYYRLNNSVVEPDYGTNQAILNELVTAVNTILDSDDSDVSRVVVAGFASPEGTFARNDRLAWERAVSVKEYLLRHTAVADGEVYLYNGSEDWRGLRMIVEASDMADKAQVLDIIDNVPVVSADGRTKPRLQQLRSLNGGKTYQYLFDHFFPRLRNGAFIRVYYKDVE